MLGDGTQAVTSLSKSRFSDQRRLNDNKAHQDRHCKSMKSTLYKSLRIRNQDMRPFQNGMGFPSFHNLFVIFVPFFLHSVVAIKPIRLYLCPSFMSVLTISFSVFRLPSAMTEVLELPPPRLSLSFWITKESIVYFYHPNPNKSEKCQKLGSVKNCLKAYARRSTRLRKKYFCRKCKKFSFKILIIIYTLKSQCISCFPTYIFQFL